MLQNYAEAIPKDRFTVPSFTKRDKPIVKNKCTVKSYIIVNKTLNNNNKATLNSQ